jgi:hydroxypyruvate reductase
MRRDAAAFVAAAIRACEPGALLRRALADSPLPPDTSFTVVAAGKAARPMLDAFTALHGERIREKVLAAGSHPVPDAASAGAGARALAAARAALERQDVLVVLLSGGASAMMAAPADGLTTTDLAEATKVLLKSGLSIAEMNAVRKHLSSIAGGQLAALAGHVRAYALSVVHAPIADDPAVIGSGPTVADPSTFEDAVSALRRAGMLEAVPRAARQRLLDGARGVCGETPKPGDPRLEGSEFVVIGSRRTAIAGAAAEAGARGYSVETIDAPIVGEARDAAKAFVAAARSVRAGHGSVALLGAGETTVTLTADASAGRGGRNQEFVLAGAAGLAGIGPAVLVSAGTDGIDGPTDAAGGFADDTTTARAAAAGVDIAAALRTHDAYDALARLGDLLLTGPTGTNVGDIQILLRG